MKRKDRGYHSDYGLVDATVQFTKEFEDNLDTRAPFVPSDDKEVAQKIINGYENKDYPFVRFSLKSPPTNGDLKNILDIGLIRATDQLDEAYCSHAADGHPATFLETVEHIREDLAAGQINIRAKRTSSFDEFGKPINVTRMEITGQPYEKIVYQPLPKTLAQGLENYSPPDEKSKERVFQIIGENQGLGTMLMTAIYRGEDSVQWTLRFINKKELREKFPDIKGPLLPAKGNRTEAEKLYNAVRRLVTANPDITLAFDPHGYHEALNELQNRGLQIAPELRVFTPVNYQTEPLAVFSGVQEQALRELDVRFADPARTIYADGHSTTLTTRMITAYPRMSQQPTTRIQLDNEGNLIKNID